MANQDRIEFRDAKDLSTVVLDHSVAPDTPGNVCASSPNSLWYKSSYYDSDFFELQLDSSSSPSLTKFEVDVSYRSTVYDVCCAELEGDPLLVIVVGYRGVTAYNTDTGEEVWSMGGRMASTEKDLFARGITADQHGRLFVFDDRNRCIEVFSVYGKYITTLLKQGEEGIAEPRIIRWSEGLSGLLFVHGRGDNAQISLIRIQS